ncbi:MAG: diacylglycerol kinase family protein, partial [Novosphingobium sp.]|nr:diacylglycerol kinase family protein [Novosphingobium sp.]
MEGSIYQFEGLPRAMDADAGVRDSIARARLVRPGLRDKPLVGVIRNPRSHRNKGHMPELEGQHNVVTASPPTRGELVRVLAGFAERGIDLLAVDGGDGTVRDVLTCGAAIFGDRWPQMIVLPKGKTNALAVDLGLPADWTLPEALAATRNGRIVERQPVAIGQADGQGAQVYGFVFGAGIFTTATQAGQTAHRYGAFNSVAVGVTAAAGVLQALFGVGASPWRKTTGMRIFTGGSGREVPHSGYGDAERRYAMAFSTLQRFPAGLNPFGRFRPGLRFVVLDAPLRRVVALVPGLLTGWDRPGFARLGVHRGATDEALVELDDSFILDGEAFPGGRYRLGV